MKSLYSSLINKPLTQWGLRIISLVIIAYFIYAEVFVNRDVQDLVDYLLHGRSTHLFWLIAAIGLMPFNWLLETAKWRFLMLNLQSISFFRAFKATLAGTTVSLFTPNRVGGFVGRILFLQPENRYRASLLSIWNNLAQLLISLSVGTIALIFYAQNVFGSQFFDLLLFSAILICLIAIALYLNPRWLTRLLKSQPFFWSKTKRTLTAVKYLNSQRLIIVLATSLLRYAVFTFQFAAVLYYFDIASSFHQLFTGVAVVFLISTVVPSITLAEFGVREIVALQVFQVKEDAELGVLYASVFIWLVNIIIPALVGQVIILTSKKTT